MKKLQNLGKALSKAEQKTINGGKKHCRSHNQCPPNQCCQSPAGHSSGFCGPSQNGTGACNGTIPVNI